MAENIEKTDRLNDVTAFVSTEGGVKGLVDTNITEIPKIFHIPSSTVSNNRPDDISGLNLTVPIIDLQGTINNKAARNVVVSKIKDAAENWGFFQVINHGVPLTLLEEMKQAVKTFHEQDPEVKKIYSPTDSDKRFVYNKDFDLYHSTPMNWKDSFICYVSPDPPNPDEIPLVCRDVLIEYSKHVMELGDLLLQLLSEALGLDSEFLKRMDCLKGFFMLCHYYPPCPQPDLTLGISKHTDNSFLTLLLQDQIGGLQILHQDYWVDVPPVPGAILVNIGDFMQLITNDKFLSVEHRVRANINGPRISVASFLSSSLSPNPTVYGPIKELLSEENPAKYRDITIPEYTAGYLANLFNEEPYMSNYRI